MANLKILYGIVLVILFVGFYQTSADFEVCNPEVSTAVYKFTKANCPYGVLFYYPVSAVCLASTNSEGHFISDLCDPVNYTIKARDDDIDMPYKIQLAFVMDDEPVDDQSSCSGVGENVCNTTEVIEATVETLTEPRGSNCDYDDEEEELTDEDKAKRFDERIFNQTERMFKYMLGLTTDHREEDSNLRLIKLVKQCFKILSTFCDTRYVPADFGKDILKAFMFLFRESDLTRFTDISVGAYLEIKDVLDACEKQPPTFKLLGNSCKTCPNIYSTEKGGKSSRYVKNEFSFTWGKYDVPVDATWGTLTFVHGLCYGSYRGNVNYHHHFQLEVERLFSKEIIYRWDRPVILNHEDLWDHLFSANIKNTMRNLDACIQGAYRGTPFLHPLERPFLERANGTTVRRKKRSVPTMTLDEAGLENAGWCFQTEDDLLQTTTAYVHQHCGNNTKALEEVKEIIGCIGASPPESDENNDSVDNP